MQKSKFKVVLSIVLCFCMLLSVMPLSVLAVSYDETTNKCDCYNVITKTDYEIAPGISESEIVLNFDDGSRRQVLHIMEADISNEYVSVLNSYYGMYPEEGNYKVGVMSEQAKWVEDNMGLNVVGAMNTTLSWYNTAFYTENPQLINSPLGFTMLNGEVIWDTSYGFPSVLVINKDFDEAGNARPADIPKVEMVTIKTEADLDGWEYQIIPCSSGFIVKDGKHSLSENHLNDNSNSAPRSVVGIKPDGTIVTMMNDGRQSPYSAGMSMYECAEVMISLGCSFAVNCDGGGTSTFLSQRPGEELKVNCSPSDGAERPTTSGILFISTAPADGAFARANISTENDYYTPGSTVTFDVIGTDLVGTEAEIPADATWQIKEDGMGTIENGVFTSNGTTGTVTAQMVYEEKVVGECSIEIVIPEAISFDQSVITVPFGKEVEIGMTATIHDGVHEVVLSDNDITFALDNEAIGTINGFTFASVEEANAPDLLSGTLTATLNCNPGLTVTASISLGKGSETIFDFENGIDGWLVGEVNGNETGHVYELSQANTSDGQVHDGNGSLRFYTDALKALGVDAGGYAQVGMYLEHSMIIENAKSLGFWAYIPDDFPHLFMRMFYWYDKNGDGIYESKNTITLVNQPTIYNTAEEDGWYYFSADISAYESIMITGLDHQAASNASKPAAQNHRFIEIASPHTNTNALWQTSGTINGPKTVYIDSITVDYSDAVDDREAPVFGDVTLVSGVEGSVALAKRNTVTTQSNLLSISASVAENTKKQNATGLNATSAKAYVDGVLVDSTYANNKISINNIAVADGVHRVKFEIYDNAGNKASVVRLVNVQSGVDASTVQVVPKDATLDRLYGGSVYWFDVKATDIETIQSVNTVLDLNSVNHWELDHMEVAKGFTADYTIDTETNTATITITRTGKNVQTGEAVLASLPVRVIYYDTDLVTEGYTAETYWNTFNFWPQDLKLDVDMGEITYVDGYKSDVLNTFSNEEFAVDTEMYTDSQHMDTTYKTERGTCHVHTAEAVADMAATCNEKGFTGRTYCAVCDSVVDWGTTLPATGHNYETVDGVLVCTGCDDKYNGELDGKTYIDGVIADGWVDNTYYYVNGVKTTGSVYMDGKMYTFDENGAYLPNYLYDGFYEIDNTVMYFVGNEYLTGLQRVNGVYYNFYENGLGFDGEIEIDGTMCTFDNGVFVPDENVLLACIAGDNAYAIRYADGKMVIAGTGDMFNFNTVGNMPWYDYSVRSTLKSVEIAEGITNVGKYAFHNSPILTSVTFKGNNIKNVETYAFGRCPALKSVILPDGVKFINGGAFHYTENIEYIGIPASTTSIHKNAFAQAKDVTLGVVSGSYAHNFAVTNGYKVDLIIGKIDSGVCGENATWELNTDGVLTVSGTGAMTDYTYHKYGETAAPWTSYRDQITKIVIGKDITAIGDYAFYNCTKLTAVEFEAGSKLNAIGEGAFGYTALVNVTLPAALKTIETKAFYFSSKLETVAFEEGAKLSAIGNYAFRDCVALKSLYIPDSTTSIGVAILHNCPNTVLNVAEGTYAQSYAKANGYKTEVREAQPSVIYDGTCGNNAAWELYDNGVLVISGTGAMADYTYHKYGETAAPWTLYREQISKIVIGKDITAIGDYAFYNCTKLTAVEFEAGSKLNAIGEGAFGYTALVNVTLPAALKTIEAKAFYFSSKLETVEFEAGSQLTTIGNYAFRDCTSLKSVEIPASVTSIGVAIFHNCPSM